MKRNTAGCKLKTTKNGESGQGVPPLLIGGVRILHERLICAGCDWLSLSVFGDSVDSLARLSIPAPDQAAPTFKGFKVHEVRSFIGGRADRHMSPHMKSPKHGYKYELWNWRGENARTVGGGLRGDWHELAKSRSGIEGAKDIQGLRIEGTKATRVDIAFDLQCGCECRPSDLRDACVDVWRDVHGMKGEIGGQDGTCEHTAYIGGKSAERRIRIYRKDIESPWLYPDAYVMRVELVLKEHYAREIYKKMITGEQTFLFSAASHIHQMTGMELVPECGEIPTREPKQTPELAGTVASLIRTYGTTLWLLREAGVDLDRLIAHRMKHSGYSTRQRWKAKLEKAKEAGPAAIEQGAYDLLQD